MFVCAEHRVQRDWSMTGYANVRLPSLAKTITTWTSGPARASRLELSHMTDFSERKERKVRSRGKAPCLRCGVRLAITKGRV